MLFDSLCVRAVSEVASDLTKTCVNLATQVMLQLGKVLRQLMKGAELAVAMTQYMKLDALVALGTRCNLHVVALSMVGN